MNNYFMETHHHEWILTNKLGSYALGTGNLINQRKYHGLLIASDKQFNRRHLIAGMEEKVEWRGEIIHLDSNNYSNCIYPEGFLYLVKPWLRPYPIFLYSAIPHQNEILIRKEIMMDADSNTVLVKYTNLGHHKLHFKIHPKYTMAIHHELNQPGSLDYAEFDTDLSNTEEGGAFAASRRSNGYKAYGITQKGDVEANRYVYYNVYYPWEVMGGYPGIGDQISLFEISFDLRPNESNILLFSDQNILNPQTVIGKIEQRYADLPKPSDYPALADEDDTLLSNLDYNDNKLFKPSEYMKLLEFSLRDFLANDDIVKGYPYYGVWGRDTMVVLNALLHMPGNLETIERILRKYSRQIKDGLIPNLLSESGREANHDTVDATLWYIILVWKVGKTKASDKYWQEVIPMVEAIIRAVLSNGRYPFMVRPDGLIELKPEFAHASWMDVRIDNQAVNPRDGAPVEINALWYNAICAYESMHLGLAEISGKPSVPDAGIMVYKEKVKASFQKFWSGDYLADRLKADEQVCEIRPNALLALALPFELLSRDKMEQVFLVAKAKLYTKYGIRSLAPEDIRFRKKYYGTQRDRDQAIHNGSVWAWLLSAYCGLFVKVYRGTKPDQEIAESLKEIISSFSNGFMKGHIASVAEVWDGDSPHFPKGAPAHAMSVAAIYNIESFIRTLQEQA